MSEQTEQFKKTMKSSLKNNRETFEESYKEELISLLGLSKEEIDKITPDNTAKQTYDKLITIVKEASRANISQAELKTQITDLGDVAIRIAKKVPSLTKLFS